MVVARLVTLSALLLALALGPACGDTGTGGDGDVNGDGDGDGDGVHDVYEDGITKQGEVFEVAILQADPSPPDRGDNTWTLKVSRDGSPVSGLTVVVSPFMPAHNHGTTPADYAGEAMTDEPGMYTVVPFDLFMPGSWSLAVAVSDDETDDEVEFFFDIEG